LINTELKGIRQMADKVTDFIEYRERMNARILESDNLDIKRFFNLDHAVYRSGALDAGTKELMGLVASMVLRCNDCVLYHLTRCHEAGVKDEVLQEALSIALVVGGSIVIPHLRFAFEMWDSMKHETHSHGNKR
jgi:AhpD family alkylhydroperoxidase